MKYYSIVETNSIYIDTDYERDPLNKYPTKGFIFSGKLSKEQILEIMEEGTIPNYCGSPIAIIYFTPNYGNTGNTQYITKGHDSTIFLPIFGIARLLNDAELNEGVTKKIDIYENDVLSTITYPDMSKCCMELYPTIEDIVDLKERKEKCKKGGNYTGDYQNIATGYKSNRYVSLLMGNLNKCFECNYSSLACLGSHTGFRFSKLIKEASPKPRIEELYKKSKGKYLLDYEFVATTYIAGAFESKMANYTQTDFGFVEERRKKVLEASSRGAKKRITEKKHCPKCVLGKCRLTYECNGPYTIDTLMEQAIIDFNRKVIKKDLGNSMLLGNLDETDLTKLIQVNTIESDTSWVPLFIPPYKIQASSEILPMGVSNLREVDPKGKYVAVTKRIRTISKYKYNLELIPIDEFLNDNKRVGLGKNVSLAIIRLCYLQWISSSYHLKNSSLAINNGHSIINLIAEDSDEALFCSSRYLLEQAVKDFKEYEDIKKAFNRSAAHAMLHKAVSFITKGEYINI